MPVREYAYFRLARLGDWGAFLQRYRPSLMSISTTSEIHVDTGNFDFACRGLWFRERRNSNRLLCKVVSARNRQWAGVKKTRSLETMNKHLKRAAPTTYFSPLPYANVVVTRLTFAGGMDVEVTDSFTISGGQRMKASGRTFPVIRVTQQDTAAVIADCPELPVVPGNPGMLDCLLPNIQSDDPAAKFRVHVCADVPHVVADAWDGHAAWPPALERFVMEHAPSQTNRQVANILADANNTLTQSNDVLTVLAEVCEDLEDLEPSPALDGVCYGAYTRLRETVNRLKFGVLDMVAVERATQKLWETLAALDRDCEKEWSTIYCSASHILSTSTSLRHGTSSSTADRAVGDGTPARRNAT